MNAKQFERIKRLQFEMRLEQLLKYYAKGAEDCKIGVYDKWYRYLSNEAAEAYDAGWTNQNKITQNDLVEFIEIPL